MDIYYIREFIALSTLKSFSKVAEEMNTTVSSASRHLQSLENELGVELVDRNARGVQLTRYGDAFLPYARDILSSYNHAESKLRGLKETSMKKLRIGASTGPSANLLSQFYLANRDVLLDYHQLTESGLLDAIQLGEVSIGIGPRDVIPSEGYIIIPFVTLTYYATVPAESRFAQMEEIPFWELSDELFIQENENSIPMERIEKLFADHHFTPKALMRVGRAARVYVASNVGVSLIASEGPMDAFINPHLRMIPLHPRTTIEICVFCKKEKHVSPNMKRLIDFVLLEWPRLPHQGPPLERKD